MKFAKLLTVTHEPCVTFVNLSQTTTPNSLLLQWYLLDWTIVIQFSIRRHSSILWNFSVFKTASPASLPRTRKRDHITPILADLQWLSVVARIEYKVAPLTFETLAYKQPSYLHELAYFASTCLPGRSDQQNRSIAFKSTLWKPRLLPCCTSNLELSTCGTFQQPIFCNFL